MDPAIQQQAINLQRELAVQLYASLMLATGLALVASLPLFLALQWNRVAALLVSLIGFLLFWIPSAPTLYLCPVMFFGGLGAFAVLTMRKPAPPAEQKA